MFARLNRFGPPSPLPSQALTWDGSPLLALRKSWETEHHRKDLGVFHAEFLSLAKESDPALLRDLHAAAVAGKSRLTIASGAIGGLDVLRAAKLAGLTSVAYTGSKITRVHPK